ncbi:MAG: hypothetical protein ACK55Z_31215, partial [bacterium]
LLGTTQGLLTHLRFHNITVQSRWASSPFQRATLFAGMVGGAAAGYAAGYFFFGDAQLRRLHKQHRQDEIYKIDSQLY